MHNFFVNDYPQSNGDHEVHKEGCFYLSLVFSKTGLGYHTNCHSAVRKARNYYQNADGCFYCSSDCHKS